MFLRLACDLDGVLADLEGALIDESRRLFAVSETERPVAAQAAEGDPRAKAISSVGVPDTLVSDGAPANEPGEANSTPHERRLTLTQRRRLWQRVGGTENFWERLKEIEPGSVGRLATLARERRWEVVFLTTRPPTEGVTVQVQSQRWLERHGFPLPSVLVTSGSRGKIADALGLDLVVDDRPENCLDVLVESKAQAILIWRDAETTIPASARRLGIGVVRSVGECLDMLAQLDSATSKPPGLKQTLKRLLGFAWAGNKPAATPGS